MQLSALKPSSFLESVLAKIKSRGNKIHASIMSPPAMYRDAREIGALLATTKTNGAAAEKGKCPNCDAECEQPFLCKICDEPCCSECAPEGTCNNCVNDDESKSKQPVAAAHGSRQPSPPVPLAEGVARGSSLLRPPSPPTVTRAVGASIPPTLPAPVARPVATVPAVPVQDLAFFLELDRSKTLSTLERWQVAESISALNRGEPPALFLSQKERDKQIAELSQKLESKATSNNEKWRICDHIEKLQVGGTPGPFVPEAVIVGQLSALEAAIHEEQDPKERFRLAQQIESVSKGSKFITKAEHQNKIADLQSRLESSKSNNERYALAAELNALR